MPLRKLLMYMALICAIQFAYSQTEKVIVFLEEGSNQPIPGVIVTISEGNKQWTLISDIQGRISYPNGASTIIQISTRHISFQEFNGAINSGQNTIRLKPSTEELNNVVVTGQYGPTSMKNSVFNVRTIKSEMIEAQGANQIADVLRNTLNIRFTRDNALGTSGMSLMGISGQNVKILINGVPIGGRSGVANEIDLEQINIQSIDRIEIVEGPMAVAYGADALAGVINIITKTGSSSKISANLTIQEESIGQEYSLWDQGIHNYNLGVDYSINDKFTVGAEARHNRFGGWRGNESGRERAWHPKSQLFGGLRGSFIHKSLTVDYRYDRMNETITDFSNNIISPPLRDPFVTEQQFISIRDFHQLHTEWDTKNILWNASASFTDYDRITRRYNTNLVTNQEIDLPNTFDSVVYQTFFWRGTGATKELLPWLSFQIGSDLNYEWVDGTRLTAVTEDQWNIGLFGSGEITVIDNLILRPGIRFTWNTIFPSAPTPSLNMKYSIGNTEFRLGLGAGYRAPSPRELFHEFIDSNHNIIGNENLNPEYSRNLNFNIAQHLRDVPVKIQASLFVNNIANRISLIQAAEGSPPRFTYQNIGIWKNRGFNLLGELNLSSLSVNTGISVNGIYQAWSESYDVNRYLFSPEINTNITWKIWKGIQLAGFYKYTGRTNTYQWNDSQEQPILVYISDFHWLDFTISKSFSSTIQATVGGRNLLNVTQLDDTINAGGVHGGSGLLQQGAGRSIFLRLSINLNHK